MDTVVQGYQPLDLALIQKQLPKNFKKIHSDKDLEAEVTDVSQCLKDLVADWKKRSEACQRIQAIAFLFDGVCSGQISKINVNFYIQQVNKLGNVLGIQIHDLRSMSAKSASITIQVLAQNLGNDFEVLALKLITKEALLKVIHSANKTLADHAHQAILSILNHVCVPKLIPRLQSEMQISKSTQFHQKMSQYLYVLVSLYPFEGVLDKHAQSIDQYIQQSVSDANSEARLNGRKSFLIWQKLAPDNAQSLFAQFDYQSQKAIIEEQEKFQDVDGDFQEHSGAMDQMHQMPPKHSSQVHNSKKNTFFSSNNNHNQQSTLSASNTNNNNSSLFGGSVGNTSANNITADQGARKNQHHQGFGQQQQYSHQNSMQQQTFSDTASPHANFGPRSGAFSGQHLSEQQAAASASRAVDKRGSLRNISTTSNNTNRKKDIQQPVSAGINSVYDIKKDRKSNHSRQSRGSRGPPGLQQNNFGNSSEQQQISGQEQPDQRYSIGIKNQRQSSLSNSQNRLQNLNQKISQMPSQNMGMSQGSGSSYQIHGNIAGSGQQNKSQFNKQSSQNHDQNLYQEADQRIDFYNKGQAQSTQNSGFNVSSSGANQMGGDDFYQQQADMQYQQYGKTIPQKNRSDVSPGSHGNIGQTAAQQQYLDDKKYTAGGADQSAKGSQQRRYGSAIHGQYNHFQAGIQRADEEMEIEPVVGGGANYQMAAQEIHMPKKQVLSYTKISKMIKSHNWSQRAQALEDFLRYLIEMQPTQLMNEFNNEKEFSPLVDQIIHKLDSETVIKIIEISLDLIELLMSSLPECLISNIEQVLICFLKQLGNRREMISDKANDLINLARETLGADFLLPHFVSILNSMGQDSSQLKTKISALDVMNVLIRESESLQEQEQETYIQYAAVIKTLGNIIKLHSSQRSIVEPVIGCIQELRDLNAQITFKAILEELSHTQYVQLKQILNQNDKVLVKQLLEFQNNQNANIDHDQEQEQQSLNFGRSKYGSGAANLNNSDQNFSKKSYQGQSVHGSIHNITQSSNVTRGQIDSTCISDNHPKSRMQPSSGITTNSNFGSQNKLGQDQSQMNSSYSKGKQNVIGTMHNNLMEQSSRDGRAILDSNGPSSSQGLSGGQEKKLLMGGGAAGQAQAMQKDQQLKQLCQVLMSNADSNDKELVEINLIKKIPSKDQAESEEQLSQQKQTCINLIINNFQILIESLLLVIVNQTGLEDVYQGEIIGANPSSSPSRALRNQSIETLTYIIKQWHRNKLKMQSSASDGSSGAGQIAKAFREGSATLEQYREEILINTLKAYSPDIAPQHQCITNQVAEDLLEWLVIASDSEFLTNTIEPLLHQEQPPKLQALLRMIQNKLRYVQKLIEQRSTSPDIGQQQFSLLIQHLLDLADVLCMLMSNANADVRKSVVFCLVEIHSVLQNNELFQQAFANKLNQSQQKLVDIYINRKKQQSAN